jgi:putative NADPH-quinone reductase
MRVLLIYCHPRPDSFCAALRDAAVSALESAGNSVEVQDLYAERFSPALSGEERALYYDEDENRRGIERYVAPLQWAEALLLIYPSWWFGLPAMLKGWLDRVWVPGVAFRLDGRGGLEPKLSNIRRIGVITTYGSRRWVLWLLGRPDWRIFHRALRTLCARGCRLDWLALHGMDTCTSLARRRFLTKVEARLARWH